MLSLGENTGRTDRHAIKVSLLDSMKVLTHTRGLSTPPKALMPNQSRVLPKVTPWGANEFTGFA